MAIPVKYRQRLLDQGQGQLVLTMYRDPCLLLYPVREWELVEKQLSDLSPLDDAAQAVRGLMMSHATDVEMDSHGRLLLPPLLRTLAKIEKDMVFTASGQRFEIWNEGAFTQKRQVWLEKAMQLDQSQLSPELKALKF